MPALPRRGSRATLERARAVLGEVVLARLSLRPRGSERGAGYCVALAEGLETVVELARGGWQPRYDS